MSTKIAALLFLASTALSSPVGAGAGHSNHTLDLRDNPVSCGWNNMFPCAAGQTCYTVNNAASCGNSQAQQTGSGGSYQMFTTTYTISEAVTITSTYSSMVGGATGGSCDANSHPCNPSLCCSSDEWCDNGTVCRPYGPADSPGLSPGVPSATMSVTTETSGSTTMTISNFIAPTSVSVTTVTSSASATTTEALETPIGSNGGTLPGVTAQAQGSGGLSGGAIAGIVIGVLAALFILFIVLACLCCKGIFDLLFGRKKKKETETYIHTHHSAHGSHHSGRPPPPPPRRFFGLLPGKADSPEKKSSGLGGLMAIGGALAALAVILGLRRRSEKRREEEKSEYTVSDDYYSDYYTETSASSASSDRRTRNTHVSHHSHSHSRR